MNYKDIAERLNPKRITDSTDTLIYELNSLLAEEFQAWYQYFITAQYLFGNERTNIKEFFEEAADDELNDHAKKIINRLNELGVDCQLVSPLTWSEYAKSKFVTADLSVKSQLEINKQSELEAIVHYQEVIEIAESLKDYTTRDILKKILADEEEHLSDLNDFIKDLTI